MTTDISKEQVEYISLTLESNVVTYHTMSRVLGIHASTCKMVLSKYYLANKSRVSASFIATGTRHGNFVVRVFDSEVDLAEKCDSCFDTVNTVHIYCLSLNNNTFSSADIASEERKHPINVTKLEGYYKLGLIKGPKLVQGVTKLSNIPASGLRSENVTKTSSGFEKQGKDAEKPKYVYQSRKQEPKVSMLSSYVSRKGEKSTRNASATTSSAVKRSSTEQHKYEYKSRKLKKSQPKERVVVSNTNEDEDLDVSIKEPAIPTSTISTTELENLFIDDFTDEDEKNDVDQETDQPIVVESGETDHSEKSVPQEAEPVVSEIPVVPANDIWKSISSKSSSGPKPAQEQDKPATETTIDEEGYIVSFKQKEKKSVSPKKPARQPVKVNKPAKKSTGNPKQSSLMSFFQKK